MIIKELKIWTEYLADILEGIKTFELRNNDKDFRKGEFVMLREFDPYSQTYLSRQVLIKIKKVYKNLENFGLKEGFCIFTFDLFSLAER